MAVRSTVLPVPQALTKIVALLGSPGALSSPSRMSAMSPSRPASSGGTHPKVGVNGLHVDVALSRFISQSFTSFHRFSLRFTGFHFHSIQHERKFLGIHASLLPSTRLCSSAKQTSPSSTKRAICARDLELQAPAKVRFASRRPPFPSILAYSASRLKRTVCCFMDILPTSHPWGTSSFL